MDVGERRMPVHGHDLGLGVPEPRAGAPTPPPAIANGSSSMREANGMEKPTLISSSHAHQLLDEMLMRSVERSSGGKATTFLCKVAILFLYRQTNTFSLELGSAKEHVIKRSHLYHLDQALAGHSQASQPSWSDEGNQTHPRGLGWPGGWIWSCGKWNIRVFYGPG